jgi:hypothetical protein
MTSIWRRDRRLITASTPGRVVHDGTFSAQFFYRLNGIHVVAG